MLVLMLKSWLCWMQTWQSSTTMHARGKIIWIFKSTWARIWLDPKSQFDTETGFIWSSLLQKVLFLTDFHHFKWIRKILLIHIYIQTKSHWCTYWNTYTQKRKKKKICMSVGLCIHTYIYKQTHTFTFIIILVKQD